MTCVPALRVLRLPAINDVASSAATAATPIAKYGETLELPDAVLVV